MGGRWPYSFCFVGCCLQDLFKIARRAAITQACVEKFDGPQIRELMKNLMFDEALAVTEVSSYKFPGKPTGAEYEKEIAELLKSFC